MSSKEQNTEKDPSKKRLTTIQKILIVGIVLILGALAVIGYMLYRAMQKEEPPLATNYVIDESNYEDILNEMKKLAKEGRFEVKMNMEWMFPSSSQPSTNAYVANADGNSKSFFIELRLKDTDELIYTSTVLPVGKAFKEIKLDKNDISAGKYSATCKYNLLNEEGEVDDHVSFNVTLIIG